MSKLIEMFTRSEKFDPVNPKDSSLSELFKGFFKNTAAGISITPDNALSITAFYSGVDIISKSISILPWGLYKTDNGRKTKQVMDHRHSLVARRPNRYQNTIEYRKLLMVSLLLRGRAVVEMVMNARGEITDLLPIHPDYYTPFRAPDGTIAFSVEEPGGSRRVLLSKEVIDIRGMSIDGLNCISPVEANKETLGIAKASELYSGRYFSNTATLSGVLETDNTLTDRAYKRLEEWKMRHVGVDNSHKATILEEGLKWKPITVNPETAQLLETRSFSVEEVSRILQIPAYKLNRMDSVKFNTTEQMSIDYLTDTLLPHIKLIELTHELALLSKTEQRVMSFDISVSEFLRGDSKARSEHNSAMFNSGSISQNEIRASEGLNPIEGGDRYYVGVNLVPIDKIDTMIDGRNQDNPPLRSVTESIFKRIQVAEVNAQSRGKDMVKFWEGHKEFIRKCLSPLKEVQDVDAFVERYYLKLLTEVQERGVVDNTEPRSISDASNFLDGDSNDI